MDDLQVVQVAPGAFYEYVRHPCVGLSFYNNPKKVITGFAPWVKEVGRRHTHAMCADPRTAVAARSCCNSETVRLRIPIDFVPHLLGSPLTLYHFVRLTEPLAPPGQG